MELDQWYLKFNPPLFSDRPKQGGVFNLLIKTPPKFSGAFGAGYHHRLSMLCHVFVVSSAAGENFAVSDAFCNRFRLENSISKGKQESESTKFSQTQISDPTETRGGVKLQLVLIAQPQPS